METEDALDRLHNDISKNFKPWEKARSVDRFFEAKNNHSRGLFTNAQTGSVNMVKNKFEMRHANSTTPTQLLGPRQKSTTPFRTARSPSPIHISTVRRRSPSPVKTGAVNRVKSRFESGGSTSSSSSVTVPSKTTQTLPKTFRIPDTPPPRSPESIQLIRPSPTGRLENISELSTLKPPRTPPISQRQRQVGKELIHDAASFLSQTLPSISSPTTRRSPLLVYCQQQQQQGPIVANSKMIRGPFGISDL